MTRFLVVLSTTLAVQKCTALPVVKKRAPTVGTPLNCLAVGIPRGGLTAGPALTAFSARAAAARPDAVQNARAPRSAPRAGGSGLRPATRAAVRACRSWRAGSGTQPRPPRPGRRTPVDPAWLPPGPAPFGPVTITTNRNPRDGQPGAGCRVSAGP